MRTIQINYNSSGHLAIYHNDNASDKRVLEVLREAARKQELRVKNWGLVEKIIEEKEDGKT